MRVGHRRGMRPRKPSTRNLCEHQERLSELSRGLSHPLRVEIVRILAGQAPDDPCICGDIVNALPLAQSTVSQHLKVLRETGWISGEMNGTSVHYCLVDGVLDAYRNLLEQVIVKKNETGPAGTPCIEKLLGRTARPRGEKHVRSNAKGN